MTNPIVIERMVKHGDVTKRYHHYWCPGCDALHGVTINPDKNSLGAGWDFSGTLEKPTYAPSQLSTWEGGEPRRKQVCHTFIREGRIEFLADCTHEMKGKTVPLPPLPDWACKSNDADEDEHE